MTENSPSYNLHLRHARLECTDELLYRTDEDGHRIAELALKDISKIDRNSHTCWGILLFFGAVGVGLFLLTLVHIENNLLGAVCYIAGGIAILMGLIGSMQQKITVKMKNGDQVEFTSTDSRDEVSAFVASLNNRRDKV